MSNLKLPNMSHRSLWELTAGGGRRLAYKTWARRHNDAVVVTHHQSDIAHIEPYEITITSAGWDSLTTAARLHAVLRDNGVTGFHVHGSRLARATISWRAGKRRHVVLLDGAVFEFHNGQWDLTSARALT